MEHFRRTADHTRAKRASSPPHTTSGLPKAPKADFMTATTFWKAFVAHKVLQGNGYAHIIRARSGEPVGLYPLNPRNVVVYWAWELGLDQRLGVERNRLFYRVTFEDGQARLYDQDDMLHVPNVGWDGKRGLFECAHTGTIFLDEIGEISPSMQGKLLRVLQEHSIRRIGAETPIPIDIRIIAATNRDLVSMVREGTFRADLYFRINVLGLCIPPLRQRQGDIILSLRDLGAGGTLSPLQQPSQSRHAPL